MPLRPGHFRTPFLSYSETFIYNALLSFGDDVSPVVYTREVWNKEKFPFGAVRNYHNPRFSLRWFMNNVARWGFGIRDARLQRRLVKDKVDVLHAHFGEEGHALLPVKRALGLPLVTTFYGHDLSKPLRDPAWSDKYAELFAEGDLFLVEGERMRQKLAALGCPLEKIEVQRIGIRLDKISFRERRARASGPAVLLFCGRFIEKKGLIYALKACRRLLDGGVKGFVFRIIGDGPLRPELENFVSDNGLKVHVEMLGVRSHAEFFGHLDEADVFVSPSCVAANGDSEGGAPTTLLEAQAAGLPAVATYHDDIPGVVAEGKSALLSPERDDEALAVNLRALLERPETWASFGRAGRAHMEEHHDAARVQAKLQGGYAKLVNKREPRVSLPGLFSALCRAGWLSLLLNQALDIGAICLM